MIDCGVGDAAADPSSRALDKMALFVRSDAILDQSGILRKPSQALTLSIRGIQFKRTNGHLTAGGI